MSLSTLASSSSPTKRNLDDEAADYDESIKKKKYNSLTDCEKLTVSTLVGGRGIGSVDGPLETAHLGYPRAIVHEEANNGGSSITYIVDVDNTNIRCIQDGTIRSLAKFIINPTALYLIPEQFRTANQHLLCGSRNTICAVSKDGNISDMSIPLVFDNISISSIVMDSRGHVLFCEPLKHMIHEIIHFDAKSCGIITFAGTGSVGSLDHQNPLQAQFNYPSAICLDEDDNVFVADAENHRIRRIDGVTGSVTTVAGNDWSAYVDGLGDQAFFAYPTSICWESKSQVLFVGDLHSIRRITFPGDKTKGLVTTIAGSHLWGCVDGDGMTARFHSISSLAIESAECYSSEWRSFVQNLRCFYTWPPGVLDIVLHYLPSFVSLLVADGENHRIRRVCSSRISKTEWN